jgi:hypothetical protein
MSLAWRTKATTARKPAKRAFEQLGLPIRGNKCEGMPHLI